MIKVIYCQFLHVEQSCGVNGELKMCEMACELASEGDVCTPRPATLYLVQGESLCLRLGVDQVCTSLRCPLSTY